MVKETDIESVDPPLQVLVVGAWLGELEPHIKALRDAGFRVTAHLPPGPEEARIDLRNFNIAVVDCRGLSPARDALSVVEELIKSRNYPIVLANTAQAERAQAQLGQLPWVRKSRNTRRLLHRWQAIRKHPRVRSFGNVSPSDLLFAVRSFLSDWSGSK